VGDALQARRGVQFVVAVTTVAALGDRTRFDTPRQLRRSLGLTPSAYSTGERRRQGGITTAGHRQARRARIAGAWASRSPPPQSVGISHCAWRKALNPSRISVGRPRDASANAIGSGGPAEKTPPRSSSLSRGNGGRVCGPLPRRCRWLH